MIGKKLGHYEILDLLGKGGMGEVYRARDTRLGREVAIKVVPEEIARNPEVRARFQREAQTISALNHPHICTLHDVGQEGDTAFLVMELVEGETLDARIARGPLPLEELLRYGGQIADALARAHRAGVVHRDLKPGNVMLTRSGAKLMDFGLARPNDGGGMGDETMAASPTVAQPLTQEGAIIGTFQYMAPEQLEGREAGPSSDMWALGCVLYEMATGRRAFDGATQASLIGSIMHQQPEPVSRSMALAPAGLDRLVQACLRKDPQERLQSAHDARLQLEWIAEGGAEPTAAAPPTPGRPWARLVPVALLLLLVGAAAAWFLRPAAAPPAALEPTRTSLGRWELLTTSTPILSPDGRSVVLVLREGNESRLARRRLDDLALDPIPGTDGAYAPFFSPDGRWLGFLTSTGAYRIPPTGGTPQLLARQEGLNSADWGDDGHVYLCGSGGSPGGTLLSRVPEDGGAPEPWGPAMEPEDWFLWLPEWLPGGSAVLLSLGTDIVALTEDGRRQTVVEDAFLGRYVEPGYLVYSDNATRGTAIRPFDPGTARVTGGAVLLTEALDPVYCFDVSSTGQLVYVPAPGEGEGGLLHWVTPDGEATVAQSMRANWVQPRVSPDGQRVLVRRGSSVCELWLLDLERASFSRVVDGVDSHDAIWAPDGQRILYARRETAELVLLDLLGSREETIVAEGNDFGMPHDWSGANDIVVFTARGASGRDDIHVRDMAGGGEATVLYATPENEQDPRLSPDGRWVAFSSTATGSPEIYIRSYPAGRGSWQVSAGGGTDPRWSRDGEELYFLRGGDGALMVSSITTGDGLVVGTPEERFGPELRPEYDVGPDGRFITVRSENDARAGQELRLLTNWPGLLRRLSGEGD